MHSIQELDADAKRIFQLTNELASLEKELALLTTNSQSTPLSKDKPVPREGLTLNEGLWPNKHQ